MIIIKFLGSKTLETERLILKAQTMDEQKYLWSLLMIPEVNKYYLTNSKKQSEELKDWSIQEKYYEDFMKHSNDPDTFRWSVFIKETGECIGRVSSFPASHEGYETNDPAIRGVAWYLDPKYNGKGYGYEAAKTMIDYLFSECEIEEIKTEAAIQNLASWKIMEKLGFVRLDKTKMVEYTYIDKPVEAYQYYLTKEMFFENNKLNKIY